MCIFTACNESSNDYLRPGELFPKADKGTIFVGESVLFTDYSTRVESRRWSFEGGNPSSSEEQQVEVNYAVAGSYDATLEITFEDGQHRLRELDNFGEQRIRTLGERGGPHLRLLLGGSRPPARPSRLHVKPFRCGESGLRGRGF